MKIKMKSFMTCVFLFFLIPNLLHAVEYECMIEKKFDSEHIYTKKQIQKNRFLLKIQEKGKKAILSRCSYANSENKVTCDSYEADQIVFDENMKIKKYYVFRSHFDVQLFNDLSFVENNGRGGISYGSCRIVSQ
jgi:hypothetical protein